MDGIINLIKPPGISSSGAITKLKRILNVRKIGHGGTLDPNAVGVLPVLLGKATRLSEYMINHDKTYIGEVTFGIKTDTQDKWGKIIETHNVEGFSIAKVERVLDRFMGTISQTPPMYSAIKINGQKLYNLARQGKDINRPSRCVTIYQIDILGHDNEKRVLMKVRCSKGTYIRTLFEDIGHALGWGGHMSFLLRSNVGMLDVNDGFTIEEIKDIVSSDGSIDKIILPIDFILDMYARVEVNDLGLTYVVNGKRIDNRHLVDNSIRDIGTDSMVRLYHKDKFIALGVMQNNYVKPTKVFYGE